MGASKPGAESAASYPLPSAATDRGGREQLFDDVYRRLASRVYNYVWHCVRDVHEADDVVSSVFEKVYLNLDRYDRNRAPLEVWVFGIARHALLSHVRKRGRSRSVPLSATAEIPADGRSPEEHLLQKESIQDVLRVLEGFRPRERQVIALKFAGGLSNQSIGRLMHLREGTVAVLLFRTLRRLRSHLDQEGQRP